MTLIVAVVLAFVAVTTVRSVFAAFNEEINYQGKLTDTSDAAVADGTYHMKFRLYDALTGGTLLHEENRSFVAGNRVEVVSGLFSVLLGSSTPFTTVDFDQSLFLEVEIGGTASSSWETLSPRKELGAVPAAFEAKNLGGASSTQYLRSDEPDTIASSSASTLLTINQSGTGDILNLLDGGTEVFTVLDGGNVGIGTSSPSGLLHIRKDQNTNTELRIDNLTNDTNATARLSFYASSSAGVVEGLLIASPENFNAFGLSHFAKRVSLNAQSQATGIDFVAGTAASDLRFYTGGVGTSNERLRIDSSGNVGIGTTSPAAKLQVSGTGNVILLPQENTQAAPTLAFGDGDTGIFENPDDRLLFSTAGTAKIAIDANGIWGFAGGQPRGGIWARTATDILPNLVPEDGDDDTGIGRAANDQLSLIAGGIEMLRLVENTTDYAYFPVGNLGIGTTTPNSTLTVTGGSSSNPPVRISRYDDDGAAYPVFALYGENSDVNPDFVLSKENGTNAGINVGIGGTTTPYAHLTIFGGKLSRPSILVDNYEDDSENRPIQFIDESGNTTFVLYVPPTGTNAETRVGIGTSSPKEVLTVSSPSGTSGQTPATVHINAATNGTWTVGSEFARVDFSNNDTGGLGAAATKARIAAIIDEVTSGNQTALGFYTSVGGGLSEAMRIDSDGNVGIGTTTPVSILTVEASTGDHITLSGNGTPRGALGYENSPVSVYYTGLSGTALSLGSNGTKDRLFIDTTGNVGIGDTSPLALLTVGASDAFQVNSSGRVQANFGASGAGNLTYSFVGDTDTGLYRSATNEIRFQTAGADRLTVNASGNVGIGTSSPSDLLHIVKDQNDITKLRVDNFTNNTNAGARVDLYASSSAGRVEGLLTSSPENFNKFGLSHFAKRVSLSAQGQASGIDLVAGTAGADVRFYTGGVGTSNERLRIDSSGKVGVATTSPWRTLSVTGTVGFDGLTASAGTPDALCLSANKEVTVNTGAATCVVSSQRFKTGITELDAGLAEVLLLEPRRFWYTEGGDERIGFVAEEVIEVEPRLVFFEEDGVTPRGVRYEDAVALAIKAIQELDLKVSELDGGTSSTEAGSGTTFAERLRNAMNDLGVRITAAAATFTNLFADNFTVGSAEKPTGITLYDEVTGEPYCFSVRNGDPHTATGVCEVDTSNHDGSQGDSGSGGGTSGGDTGDGDTGGLGDGTDTSTTTDAGGSEAGGGSDMATSTDNGETEGSGGDSGSDGTGDGTGSGEGGAETSGDEAPSAEEEPPAEDPVPEPEPEAEPATEEPAT